MKTYKITEELFTKAMTYSQRRTRLILLAACIVVPMIIHAWKGFPEQTSASVLIVYLILAFYLLILGPLVNHMNYRRTYRKNPLLHKPHHVEINEEEIIFRSDNGESRYQYADIKQIMFFPEMVMLYPTTTIFHIVPLEILSETERNILVRHQSQ